MIYSNFDELIVIEHLNIAFVILQIYSNFDELNSNYGDLILILMN